jgi:hypothetical protein
MLARFLVIGIFCCVLNAGQVCAEEGKAAGDKDIVTVIIESTLGKEAQVVRREDAEKSPVSGFKQIRVWFATPYGEAPVLFYVSEDGKTYFAGTVFDDRGNNLTKRDAGTTKPRMVKESDLKVNDDYRIGPKDAGVRAVLWIGTDPYSRYIFDTFYELYENNPDKVSLSIKFYPRSQGDMAKMIAIACLKGGEAVKVYREMKEYVPDWGNDEDLAAFREKHGLKDKECGKEIIKKDLELSLVLKLPSQPVVFINGTMVIEEQTKEMIGEKAGVELR